MFVAVQLKKEPQKVYATKWPTLLLSNHKLHLQSTFLALDGPFQIFIFHLFMLCTKLFAATATQDLHINLNHNKFKTLSHFVF